MKTPNPPKANIIAIEIERRFLVKNDAWKAFKQKSEEFQQGYISNNFEDWIVRIRIIDQQKSEITLKALAKGIETYEFEYPIPFQDAQLILKRTTKKLNKTRYFLSSTKTMSNFTNDFINLKKIRYKKVKHLSVGQQRKLAIYCSVLNINLTLGIRFVWVLDEPMANLDKESIKILLDFILHISQMNHIPFLNASVILSAHDHSLLENELSLLIRI